MSDRDKCIVDDGRFVRACSTLDEASSGTNPHGTAKGIFAWAWSTQKGPTRTFYGTRGGAYPKGMVFNYCPFCGVDISAPAINGGGIHS